MKKIIFFSIFLMLILSVKGQDIKENYWQVLPDTAIADDASETWKLVNDSVLSDSTYEIEKMVQKKAPTSFHPELMIIGGAGYNPQENFGFSEGRLMFKIGRLRIGPYLGYTQYGVEKETPTNALLGKEIKYGLSFDSYGFWTDNLSHYFWLNTGIKNVRDHYEEKYYDSKTKTNLIFLSAGLSLSNEVQEWFSHNQLLVDYQKPLNASIDATWKGTPIKNSKAYDKESLRITLESGIVRFYVRKKVNFEPIIHLGYGKNFGSSESYREYGGGIGFGFFKEWYRDILKVKMFYRDREIGNDRLNLEAVINLTSLVNVLK